MGFSLQQRYQRINASEIDRRKQRRDRHRCIYIAHFQIAKKRVLQEIQNHLLQYRPYES